VQGSIKFYNATKGYGFVVTEADEWYFHATSIEGKWQPEKGDSLSLARRPGDLVAVNIAPICDSI
jgi:cold shock CspA family protein